MDRPRASWCIEDSLLNGRGICEAPDYATEGIHFMHQLALGWSTHGRIAGLPGDSVEVEGEQRCVKA